jgi:hypothetical protein
MSSPATPTAPASVFNWSAIATDAGDVVAALAPLVALAAPGASAAISIGVKIIQGVIAAEPTAVALYNQIQDGTPATAAQLQTFASDYETSYQKLNTDIAVKLAALPPA